MTSLCIFVTAAVIPRALIGRDADAAFDDESSFQRGLADHVAHVLEVEAQASASLKFTTGDARIDGEWALVTHEMAALGFCQIIAAHPELRDRYLPAARAAVKVLASDEIYRFGDEAWGAKTLSSLGSAHGQAYLGYAALGMGALRSIDPATDYGKLHDTIIAALVRRLDALPNGDLETYPGELYPADISSVIGAIGQHARLTGADHHALLERMSHIVRDRWIDAESGYLAQTIHRGTGLPVSEPRGASTALAAYFISFADPALSQDLARSVLKSGRATFLGFGGTREYPPNAWGLGDVDSGPVVLGVSVAATGFALASARMRGERDIFRELFRTTQLFGVPVSTSGGWHYLTGGPLGNALLLAMMTARAP